MADPRGFLNIEQQKHTPRPVYQRIKDYNEIYQPLPEESIRAQASRCMDCGVPFCHTGCPLGNLIPDWNDLVHRNRWEEALKELHSTNNFPEFTGKTCPAPCEASCVLEITSPAVTIKNIELAIVDKGWEMGWIVPTPPEKISGKKVAVIGSGPAGLAAAQQLCRAGHAVTVYEKDDMYGGLLIYGIPDFKMGKFYIERRINQMEGEGVKFINNADVGKTISAEEILSSFDAILMATGSSIARELEIQGRNMAGIELAMPFLTQQNRRCLDKPVTEKEILATGKNVIIIGGGDTAADCLGTCHRQGAKSIMQIDYNPRPPENYNSETPWPLWPKILRLSPAHEEGGRRDWQIKSSKFVGDSKGHVKELHAVRVNQFYDETGERQFEEIRGTDLVFPCDLALIAIGFTGADKGLPAMFDVEIDSRGNIGTGRKTYRTSKPNIFAAGDARRGQSLVVWAIAEGREAAREIDEFLMGKSSQLKARDTSLLQIGLPGMTK
jgi:glutamate synthase (NADPH/NADH) small chain